MYYSYIEIEYVATSFSPARKDLALKLLTPPNRNTIGKMRGSVFQRYRGLGVTDGVFLMK